MQPFLRRLADFTTDKDEELLLHYLCSKQGAQDYLSKVRGPSLCLLDVLLALPSCNPNVETLLENLPRLQPRPYSVASVCSQDGDVDIVFNVVELPQKEGRMFSRKGLCTGWMEKMILNNALPKKVCEFEMTQQVIYRFSLFHISFVT